VSEPLKLVTRAQYMTAAKVCEKLRSIIDEIENGRLKEVISAAIVLDSERPDGTGYYTLRTTGITNAQALWLLEVGKRVVLEEK
jgi:hypothetical protein